MDGGFRAWRGKADFDVSKSSEASDQKPTFGISLTSREFPEKSSLPVLVNSMQGRER